MPVSGSAKPNEPPAPGVPKAFIDEPKRQMGLGLLKPKEKFESMYNTLSRNPFVGGCAGVFRASRAPSLRPSSGLLVAALPYSLAIERAVPVPLTAGISTTRRSSRLKSARDVNPLRKMSDRAVRAKGLHNARTKPRGMVFRCSSSFAKGQECRYATRSRSTEA